MRHSSLSASRTPFIRLLLPLLAGIGCGEWLSLPGWVCLLSALGGVLLWSMSIKRDTIEEQLLKRRYWGIGLFLLVFALGLGLYRWQHRPIDLPHKYYPTAIAHIDQKATEKDNSYYCQATLSALCDSNGVSVAYEMPIALYIEKSLNASRLLRGDIIALPFTPQPIKREKNPDEPDFAKLMKHKGISYSQFLRDNQWRYLGEGKADLRSYATTIQDKLIKQLYRCNLDAHSTTLLQAMLLGEQQKLSPELRHYFSAAGISHILAVSGLHIGIVGLLIYGLLYPLTFSRKLRWWRPIVVLLALWGYCFITGLSPSAVRATIMASFLLVAELIGRRNSSLNALFAAAFFMLLYDTNLLFQISFQLSFASVASILLLYPRLNLWGNSRHRIVRWLSSSIAVSVAAQIGTLPLSLYYFHTLPILFFVGNLLVLPLLPFIFGGGFLLLLLSYLQLPVEWLGDAIEISLHFIEQLSVWIYQLPGSHFESIWLEARYLWAYMIGAILLYIAFRNRSKRVLWSALGLSIAFLVVDLYHSKPVRPELIVYDDNEQTVVQLSEGETAYLMLPDTLATRQIAGENHRMRNGQRKPELYFQNSPNVKAGNIFIDYPFAQIHGKTLLLLDSTAWQSHTTPHPLPIDYAIIDNQFHGKIENLSQLFTIRQVIIASNVHPSRAGRLAWECDKLGITYHNIRTQGVWVKEMR